jgi:Ca2+:H+ antiporter
VRRTTIVLAAVAALTAGAGAARFGHAPSVLAFLVAAAALAGLAWVVSFATEQVGERFGSAATGVLQSTLGNLPEFFIVIFALRAGEVVVAETSIVGSVFANALLVLGLVLVIGARTSPDGVMRFRPRLPRDNALLMLLASFLVVLLGLVHASHDRASHHVVGISTICAVALLAVYVIWLVDYLRTERDHAAAPSVEHGAPVLPLAASLVLLGVAGVGAAFVSDWFIAALAPAMDAIGVPTAFSGLVIVAIAGNAVENTAGLVLARKADYDLAISVVKNSVAQIVAFLYPALVLVSLCFDSHLTFNLSPVLTGALLLTALALFQITADGEATAFEGVALLALYAILATTIWYE